MALVEASPVGEPTGREPPFMGERAGGPPEAPIAPQGKKTAGLGCSMGDVLMMPGHIGGVGMAFAAALVAPQAPQGAGAGGAPHGSPMSAMVTTEPGI